MRLALAWVGLALASLGCSDDSGLTGSLTDFYDTSFHRVRARLYSSELAIEFVRDNGEVPVRITVRASGEPLQAKSYDLSAVGDITGRSHDTDLPPLVSGDVEFGTLSLSEGGAVEGSFEARFRTGDDTTSLTGKFAAKLEVVGGVTGYDYDGYPPRPDVADVADGETSD